MKVLDTYVDALYYLYAIHVNSVLCYKYFVCLNNFSVLFRSIKGNTEDTYKLEALKSLYRSPDSTWVFEII